MSFTTGIKKDNLRIETISLEMYCFFSVEIHGLFKICVRRERKSCHGEKKLMAKIMLLLSVPFCLEIADFTLYTKKIQYGPRIK